MTKKTIPFICAQILILLFLTNCKGTSSADRDSSELVVAMDVEMPGYFVLSGESYGYQYDLFKAYADQKGLSLRVVSGKTPSQCEKMLKTGEVDIVTTLTNHVTDAEQPDALAIYSTSYVLLGRKGSAAKAAKEKVFSLTSFLKNQKLLVSSGFKISRTYEVMLDSLRETSVYVSSRNCFELIESLGDSEYDYVVCEMSEAQLGCALMRNVEQVYTFSEPIAVSAVLSSREPGLEQDFKEWLSAFRNGAEYAVLNDLYFEKGIVNQLLNRGVAEPGNGMISVYDDLFKQVCDKEGYDWRLISAIAYSESRFNAYIISNKGAKGIMQIMPWVAKQFGVATGDMMTPEKNIALAVKILDKIEKSLSFHKSTPRAERMKIVLACYNAGIGHVLDARNLARRNGGNPDSWESVSRYLTKTAEPKGVEGRSVKNGSFNGGQTIAFVNQVVSKYNFYCSRVSE